MNYNIKSIIFEYLNYEALVKMLSIDNDYMDFVSQKNLSSKYFGESVMRLSYHCLNDEGEVILDYGERIIMGLDIGEDTALLNSCSGFGVTDKAYGLESVNYDTHTFNYPRYQMPNMIKFMSLWESLEQQKK